MASCSRSEEAAARQRADELAAAAVNVVGRGEIEAWAAHAESLRLGASNAFLLINGWAAVRDRWRSLRQPYPEAYASLRVAERSLAAGDRRAAVAELSSATTLAAQLGAAPLAAPDRRRRPPRRNEAIPTPGSDGLTPREREILNRVLAGASNRDIAKALFISPKTVSVHVSALLRKFGVSGRGDLMALRRRASPRLPSHGCRPGCCARQLPIRAFASNRNQDSIASTQSLQHLYLSENMQQAQSLTGPTLARTTTSPAELKLFAPLIEGELGAGLLSVMIFPALAVSRLPKRLETAGARDRVAIHSEAM